jgi:GNAT superfamily N-acetyltransferase
VISHPCDACGAAIEGDDIDAYGEAFLVHVRADHPEWPYPDQAVRNVGAGTIRLEGAPTERLDTIGTVEVHRVTADRIDDFLDLFDHKVFAGFPQWSACYCLEPHEVAPDGENPGIRPWRERRNDMAERLRTGTTVGYLAYVDGAVAGWVNASRRGDYSLFRRDDGDDDCTVGVACFAIAPPYRGHGIAKALLDHAVADAAARDAQWIEAYPFNDGLEPDNPDFRGPRSMYDARAFTEVQVRARDTVVRRPVTD